MERYIYKSRYFEQDYECKEIWEPSEIYWEIGNQMEKYRRKIEEELRYFDSNFEWTEGKGDYQNFDIDEYRKSINRSIYWHRYMAEVAEIAYAVVSPMFRTFVEYDLGMSTILERECRECRNEVVYLKDAISSKSKNNTYERISSRYQDYVSDTPKLLGYVDSIPIRYKQFGASIFKMYLQAEFNPYRKFFSKSNSNRKFSYEHIKGYCYYQRNEFGLDNEEVYLFDRILGVNEALYFDEYVLPNLQMLLADTIESLIDSVNKLNFLSARVILYKTIVGMISQVEGLKNCDDIVQGFWCDIIEYYAERINDFYDEMYNLLIAKKINTIRNDETEQKSKKKIKVSALEFDELNSLYRNMVVLLNEERNSNTIDNDKLICRCNFKIARKSIANYIEEYKKNNL